MGPECMVKPVKAYGLIVRLGFYSLRDIVTVTRASSTSSLDSTMTATLPSLDSLRKRSAKMTQVIFLSCPDEGLNSEVTRYTVPVSFVV